MNEVFEEVRAALYSAWARKWLVLGVAWAVCLAGWLAVAMIPNTYESKAKIFIQLDDLLSKQIGISGSDQTDIARVRQTLASASTLEKVIRSTKLGDTISTPQQMERAVTGLGQAVTVKSEEQNLFEITAKIGNSSLTDAQNARLAQDVVQKLLDIFREENVAGSRGEVAEAVAVLDKQLAQRAKELQTAEERRTAFEAAHPQLIGGAEAISTKLQNAQSDKRGVDADLAAAQSALAAINGQLAGTPRTLPGSAAQAQGPATQAYNEALSQVAQLRARGLTDSHPDMQAAQRQVQMLKDAANRENGGGAPRGTPNPAYSSLISIKAERQANVEALLARKAALQSDISGIVADQTTQPELGAEAQSISRDYKVLQDKYDELLQDREEMQLRSQVESQRSSFRFDVIDAPALPLKPVAPNRPLLLIGVLIAGIGAGMAAAIAIGQLKSTFATAAGLERALGLPVLGAISTSLTEARRKVEARRLKLFIGGSAALGGVLVLLLAIEMIQVGSVA